MNIDNLLVYYKNKENYLADRADLDKVISDDSIVFVESSGTIFTHGHEFGAGSSNSGGLPSSLTQPLLDIIRIPIDPSSLLEEETVGDAELGNLEMWYYRDVNGQELIDWFGALSQENEDSSESHDEYTRLVLLEIYDEDRDCNIVVESNETVEYIARDNTELHVISGATENVKVYLRYGIKNNIQYVNGRIALCGDLSAYNTANSRIIDLEDDISDFDDRVSTLETCCGTVNTTLTTLKNQLEQLIMEETDIQLTANKSKLSHNTTNQSVKLTWKVPSGRYSKISILRSIDGGTYSEIYTYTRPSSNVPTSSSYTDTVSTVTSATGSAATNVVYKLVVDIYGTTKKKNTSVTIPVDSEPTTPTVSDKLYYACGASADIINSSSPSIDISSNNTARCTFNITTTNHRMCFAIPSEYSVSSIIDVNNNAEYKNLFSQYEGTININDVTYNIYYSTRQTPVTYTLNITLTK